MSNEHNDETESEAESYRQRQKFNESQTARENDDEADETNQSSYLRLKESIIKALNTSWKEKSMSSSRSFISSATKSSSQRGTPCVVAQLSSFQGR